MTALILTLAALAAPTHRAIDGATVSLSSPDGSVVVLWSMDCTECIETMTALEDAGLPYVSLNTDGAAVTSRLRGFAEVHNLTAPIIADTDGSIQRALQARPNQTLALRPSGEVAWRMSSRETDVLISQVTMVAAQ